MVHFDSAPADQTAMVKVHGTVASGDRVYVDFEPPRGMSITGCTCPPAAPAAAFTTSGDLTVFSTSSFESSGSTSFLPGIAADGVIDPGAYTLDVTCTVTGPSDFPAAVVCGATISRDDDFTVELEALDGGAGTDHAGTATGTGTITGGTTYTGSVGASWSGPPNDETTWTVHYVVTATPV
jgi:hypothetical protein